MKYYTDTSFLFSYYASDPNSSRADLWRMANAVPIPLTPLHRLELRNALELAVFQKRLVPQEVDIIWQQVEDDLRDGLLDRVSFPLTDLFVIAETLAVGHTAEVGSRSLDVLHIAATKILAPDEFVTFDKRQATLAQREGLKLAAL